MSRLTKVFVLFVSLIGLSTWCGSAMAAPPAWQASSAIAASTGADVTVTLPAHAANDILLLQVVVRDVNDTITWPAGWTQIATVDRGTTARYWWAWSRAASAAEPNPLVNKSTTNGDTYAAVTTYRGAITTGDPWEVKGTPNTSTAAGHVLNGITTLTAESLIVASLCGENNSAASGTTFNATDPASLTQVLYVESATGSDGACTAGAGARTATGATGGVTATWTATVVGSGGIVLALKPAPPAVTSINRADPDPTTAASVSWTVTFNISVTGVASGNFTLVNSGLGGAPAITSVTGSGTTWTVTASTGTGTGTLGLDMTDTAGVSPAITNLPFTGQVYSVRPLTPVVYYHDTTTGVNIGFDGLTNVVSGTNVTIPPIITASLTTANTCTGNARSNNHPVGLYTHSRWYLNANYAVATNIGANPGGSARLRGGAATDTVIVRLYDYDPVSGGKTLIGSSAPITLTTFNVTTNYPYTISSPLYTMPAGHRLMLEYNFNQPVATYNARVYCSSTGAYIAVTETTATAAVSSINLAAPSPTSAATVSWTVTFDKSVTGVDANAFTLAASGVSGAYITAVTGSGAIWTVTANTGIGAGTLGLNQTGPGSVVPTLSGTFTGQVYTITATPALAEYRMDEASWNGTANEVVDSSGSGNHAQAFNSANTTVVTGQEAKPGNPGTCRYGVFDNGGTITQGYVQTPLPNLTTDFTIAAWIRTTNNTIAGQRILIDDQGAAPTTGYGFSLGDGAAGILRFYSRGITPIILDSTYTIANNTWYFVAAVADIANKRRTIYVFNAAGALLNSTAEAAAFTGTWGTDGGPVSIGAETNASAELPATYHFRGNLDEVRVYQKVLSQNALAAIAAQSHACAATAPDHLEIQHASGAGLTCAASTLTIRACADAACTLPYTSGVSGTLAATGTPTVNWDGTTGGAAGAGFAIPGGGSSVTKNVQVATAGSVAFGIASPSPLPTNATTCNFGSPSCTFTASLAGFIFSDTTTGNSYAIPAQVSGIATSTLYLRAVQASTTNPAVCTPAIIGQTTAVNMGYACNNPATCQAGNLATINATTIASGGTAVSLTFDANGSAPITARYDDVGQVTLNANKTVTPFGGATAVTLNGNSNSFVVKPDHFDLSGIQQTAAPNLANPAAADATGNRFVMAGEQFSVTVTAKNALGATTANYGKETPAESVKLTSALASGLGLTNNPAVGGTFGAFTNGVATGTAFTWNEVGIIKLTPGVGDGDYLGAGDTSGTQTGNVGRFYAAKFALSGGVIANRTGLTGCAAPAGCGAFTYMGEQMSAVFNLIAKAVDSTTTLQNYVGAFSKLDPAATGTQLGLAAVDTGTPRTVVALDTTLASSTSYLNPGEATITAPFSVTRGGSASVPFDALDVGVNPADSDGAVLAALDLAVNAGGTPNTHGKVGTTKARYGRMKLSNAHGSELLPLPIPMEVQYWQGQYWAQNSLDDATTIVQNNIKLSNVAVTISGVIKDAAGKWRIVLSKPLTPVSSNVCLDLDAGATGDTSCQAVTPLSMRYLQTGGAFDKDPASRATFGVYKGNNEFIYLRETY